MTFANWPRPALAAALVVAALTLGACSGGDDDDATATATPTPTASAAAEFAVHGPDELDSYRYTMTVAILASALDTSEAPPGLPLDGTFEIDVAGEVVNPGREHATTAIDIGFLALTTEFVRIDDQGWSRAAGGAWDTGTAEAAAVSFFGTEFSPSTIFIPSAEFSYADLSVRLAEHDWTPEDIEGVPTRHFVFTEEELEAIFQADQTILPVDLDASYQAEMWFSDPEGYPVRMVVVGTGTDGTEVMRMEMTLLDLNTEIVIEPPI